MEIHTYKKEYDELKIQFEEENDFWEWYEDKHQVSRKELFEEFLEFQEYSRHQ